MAIDIDDLTRYTLAAGTKEDAKRYEHADTPAVRRLVNMVCRMAADRQVPVYMCGVKANVLPAMETYLRDGVRAFCMESAILNELKAGFLEVDLTEAPAEPPAGKALPLPVPAAE